MSGSMSRIAAVAAATAMDQAADACRSARRATAATIPCTNQLASPNGSVISELTTPMTTRPPPACQGVPPVPADQLPGPPNGLGPPAALHHQLRC
jgi:hypothetical protein